MRSISVNQALERGNRKPLEAGRQDEAPILTCEESQAMKNAYTIYFAHLDTLEVICCHRVSVSARQARKNFLRRMRQYEVLCTGDHYRIAVVEGRQPLDYPRELFEAAPICIAR